MNHILRSGIVSRIDPAHHTQPPSISAKLLERLVRAPRRRRLQLKSDPSVSSQAQASLFRLSCPLLVKQFDLLEEQGWLAAFNRRVLCDWAWKLSVWDNFHR